MSVLVTSPISGYTNGVISIPDYTLELVALNTNLTALNTFLTTNYGIASLSIPGSQGAINQSAAGALNDMSMMIASMMSTATETSLAIKGVQVALAGVSAQVAQGVTTQQMAVADQIKNNQFQQATTNAALTRSDLPPTVVPTQTFQERLSATINDTVSFKSLVGASSLISSTLSDAATYTTTLVTGYIAESYVGTSAVAAWTAIKTFFGFNAPEQVAKQSATELKVAARTAKIGP
jgi:hypothetical protein